MGVAVVAEGFAFFGHVDGLFPVGGSFFEGLTQTALILMHDGSILIPKGAVAERQ